jgi:hypothetical protein
MPEARCPILAERVGRAKLAVYRLNSLWRCTVNHATLARAVERLAGVTQGASDADLDRPWAWGAYDSEGVRFALFRTYEELRELAARLASERATSGPPASTAQRILAQYRVAYRDLQAVLLGISIVAHIVGADVGFFGVVQYALERHRTGDGRPAEIPDEAWDVLLGEDGDTIDALLDGPLDGILPYYEQHHVRTLQAFAGISEEELALPSMYWEGYDLSLRFRLHRFDSHLRQHIVQLEKTLVGIGRSPNEARRLLRMIYAALADVEGTTIGAWGLGAELRQEAAQVVAARGEEIGELLA